ncbi:HK97 family phage prohead protease [Vibrio parahaemolyticus]|uniref:HK97 family phage prohead protease n=1 Tax=Vibrio parahaemolyticus TaxID=670 RepID=UPI0030EE3ECA
MKHLVKTLQFNAETLTSEGVVSGVLNHFNNKDHAGDVTLKGAFLKSIAALEKSGRFLVMLWQHDPTKPIGVWKNLRETERGLEGDGYINLDVELGREAYALAKQGALTGISIGYWVVDEHYDPTTGINYLKEVELRETSLVTFPCNEHSRIDEVKHMKLNKKGLPTVDALKEHLLGSGMDKDMVEAVVAKYMPDYVSPEEQEAAKAAALEEINKLAEEHGLEIKVADKVTETTDKVTTVEEVTDEETKDDGEEEEQEGEDELEGKAQPIDLFFK